MAKPAARTSKTEYTLKLWNHLQIRISGIMEKETTFHDLTKFMGNTQNIKLTANFFMLLSSFCNKTPLQKANSSGDTQKARLILSALMVTKFPNDVLDVADIKDLDPSSEACYKSAKNMIQCIMNNKQNNMIHCQELLQFIQRFEDAFENWKTKDLEKVLESVVNYYTQWMRSYKVLCKSSMNEAQKKLILSTLTRNMDKSETRIAKLVGVNQAQLICQQIKDKINAEPDTISTPQQRQMHQEEEKKADIEREPSLEEKLAAKGVPMNIKSGRNLLKQVSNDDNGDAQSINEESKYVKDVDGQKMLDLDMIIMEEASKRYWNDFKEQIENQDFSRLFELLTELLKRIKVLSPEKEHKHLDDLMDVSFIQQTIENGMIDAKGFYAIFYGIWAQIKSLHAANEDKMWQIWHDHIVQQFGADDATWGTLLVDVFNVFLRKMDKIEDQIKVINYVKDKKKKEAN